MTNQSLAQNNSIFYDECNGTIAALRSYSEYAKSYSNKLMKFLEKENTRSESYIAVEIPGDTSADSMISYLSKTAYDQLVNGELDEVECIVNKTGDTVKVSGDVVLDSIENNLAEVQLQADFIDACLDNAENKVTDFITIVKAKYSGVSGSMISKYQDLWDSSSPFNSLKNLLGNKDNKEIEYDDNEISIFNKDEYQGGGANLFSTALLEVFSDITSFFDKVWQGIADLQGFFRRVWDGILNILKYVIGKAFGQLMTNFEKGSDRIGILDVPLMQAPLFHVYVNKHQSGRGYTGDISIAMDYDSPWIAEGIISSNNMSGLKEAFIPLRLASDLCQADIRIQDPDDPDVSVRVNQHCRRYDYDNWKDYASIPSTQAHAADLVLDDIGNIVNANAIVHQLFYLDGETNALFPRLLDIVIPCSQMPDFDPVPFPRDWSAIKYNPCDIIARFGVVKALDHQSYTDFMVVLQIFPILQWDQVNNSPDRVTACNLWDSMYALGEYLCSKYWITLKGSPNDGLPLTKSFASSMAWGFATRCISLDFSELERWTEPPAGTFDLANYLSLDDNISFDNNGCAVSSAWQGIKTDLELHHDTTGAQFSAAATVMFVQAILRFCAFAGPGYADKNGNAIEQTTLLALYRKSDNNEKYYVNGTALLYVSQQYPISSNIIVEGLDNETTIYNADIWHYSDGHGSSWPDDVYISYLFTPATTSQLDQALIVNNITYTPYASYCPFGIAVHYQTYREQVQEVKNVIWAAIIALVGVTIAIVGHKFKKKRLIKANLAQARLDSMSWDIANNPTKQQIKAYGKAMKASKRINKMNSLLGIGSPEDSTASIITAVSQVKTQLLSTQGYNEEDDNQNGATIGKIKNLITGD